MHRLFPKKHVTIITSDVLEDKIIGFIRPVVPVVIPLSAQGVQVQAVSKVVYWTSTPI